MRITHQNHLSAENAIQANAISSGPAAQERSAQTVLMSVLIAKFQKRALPRGITIAKITTIPNSKDKVTYL